MNRPARSLFATVALAALPVLLAGALPAARTVAGAVAAPRAASPVAPPVIVAPAAVTVTAPHAAQPVASPATDAPVVVPVARPRAAAPAVPRVTATAVAAPSARVPADSADFESAAGDSFAPPQLFLAWHAPYGTPGATDTISFGIGDSTRTDTLYMSFETGRNTREFLGMLARLYFHPAFGDTLGTYWRYDYGSPNYRNVEIQFDPDGTFPCPQPWIRNGIGMPEFEFDPGGAKLELFYGVARTEDAIQVDGSVRYCFARVMFRQRQWNLPGARQPICLEWSYARLPAGQEDTIARRGAGRCVSMNSPDGSVCRPYRTNPGPAHWTPPPQRP